MKTLTEFQNEVLTPIRKERDEKMAITYAKEHTIKKAYMDVRNQLTLDRVEFERQQARERDAFVKEQERKLREFFCKQKIERDAAYDTWHRGCCEVKIARRSIHEQYQDKFGLALSEYNKERVAAGTPPLIYQRSSEEIVEQNLTSESKNE